MLNDQTNYRPSTSHGVLLLQNGSNPGEENDNENEEQFRDIHPLTPPHPAPAPTINRGHRRETWETSSHRSSSTSMASEAALSENFTSMSREFSALVLAGSAIGSNENDDNNNNNNNNHTTNNINNNGGNNMNLGRIGEDDMPEEETNPLAIVPDNSPLDPTAESPRRRGAAGAMLSSSSSSLALGGDQMATSLQRVKKEEVESKILAWQNAKVSKINNRFKRDDAIIGGWESEQVQKATSWMKKVEREWFSYWVMSN